MCHVRHLRSRLRLAGPAATTGWSPAHHCAGYSQAGPGGTVVRFLPRPGNSVQTPISDVDQHRDPDEHRQRLKDGHADHGIGPVSGRLGNPAGAGRHLWSGPKPHRRRRAPLLVRFDGQERPDHDQTQHGDDDRRPADTRRCDPPPFADQPAERGTDRDDPPGDHPEGAGHPADHGVRGATLPPGRRQHVPGSTRQAHHREGRQSDSDRRDQAENQHGRADPEQRDHHRRAAAQPGIGPADQYGRDQRADRVRHQQRGVERLGHAQGSGCRTAPAPHRSRHCAMAMIATVITSTRSTGSETSRLNPASNAGRVVARRFTSSHRVPPGDRPARCAGAVRVDLIVLDGQRPRRDETDGGQGERRPGGDDEQHPGRQRPGQVERQRLHGDEPGVGPFQVSVRNDPDQQGLRRSVGECLRRGDREPDGAQQRDRRRPGDHQQRPGRWSAAARDQVRRRHHLGRVESVDQRAGRDRHEQPGQR